MFCHWLFSLLICIVLSLHAILPQFMQNCTAKLEQTLSHVGIRVVGIILLVIYLALSAFQLLLILNRKRKVDRGFITIESSETGRVRIAVSAVEQLVRQSVRNIDGITGMDIHFDNLEDAIGITVNVTIASGSHVPTITMNMQRSIRQFVEVHCGVEVRMVTVSINAVSNQPENSRRHMMGKPRTEGRTAGSPQDRKEQTDVGTEAKEKEIAAPMEAPIGPEAVPEPVVSEPEKTPVAPVESAPEAAPSASEASESEPKATPVAPVESAPEAGPSASEVSESEPEATPAAAAELTPEPAHTDDRIAAGEAAGTTESNAPADEPEPVQTAVGYDFHKPYESEFARDFAEMKARESSKNEGR